MAVKKLSLRAQKCHYCGTEPGATLDHIVPRVLGGPYSSWNLQPACWECNRQKTDNWPTCDCAKCQTAIRQFCQNPVWVAKAVNVLTLRRDVLAKNIELIQTIRLPALQASMEREEAQAQMVLNLGLTHGGAS